MQDFIEYVARGLVDHPDEVHVKVDRWRDRVIYRLSVADGDMGKVIGKGGRIAGAMRNVLRVGAVNDGARVTLDIGQPG